MPRGRPRKRLSRTDAAVDAMLPYGFTEEQVLKHVNELLKAYGGDEGWPFIEDCAYKELIESILRDEERNDQEQVAQDGDKMKDKSSGNEEHAETSSRASDTHQDGGCQANAPTDIVAVAEPTGPEPVHSVPVIDRGEADKEGSRHTVETGIPVNENDKGPPTEVHSPTNSRLPALRSLNNVLALPHKDTPTRVHSPESSRLPASRSLNNILALPPTNSRRCWRYGWIDSDEDGHDDFILLKPASGALGAKPTLTHELSNRPSDLKRKRSRWDLRPDDP